MHRRHDALSPALNTSCRLMRRLLFPWLVANHTHRRCLLGKQLCSFSGSTGHKTTSHSLSIFVPHGGSYLRFFYKAVRYCIRGFITLTQRQRNQHFPSMPSPEPPANGPPDNASAARALIAPASTAPTASPASTAPAPAAPAPAPASFAIPAPRAPSIPNLLSRVGPPRAGRGGRRGGRARMPVPGEYDNPPSYLYPTRPSGMPAPNTSTYATQSGNSHPATHRIATIQGTDTDAALSRLSAVEVGLLDDPFAQYFAGDGGGPAPRRLPIINRGRSPNTSFECPFTKSNQPCRDVH